MRVLTKITSSTGPQTFIEACWKKRICLYNKKSFKDGYKNYAKKFKDFAGQEISLQIPIHVAHKEGGEKTDITLSKVYLLMPPEITSLETQYGTILADPVSPGDIIVIKGKYFGNKAPKVWLEYLNEKDQVKMVRCKVLKPYYYEDVKGRSGKSCMDKTTGISQITVQMPKKWPKSEKGWVNGIHDIVIDNRIGMATATIKTQ
jgi:hypothetical protein